MLPPLNAIRAFETAARHLSFAKAAEELHVTRAALSHQIAGLEKWLGLKLFHRQSRGISLTEEGAVIYPPLHSAFQTIVGAFERLDKQQPDKTLVVTGTPGFIIKWLVPRIHKFISSFPDIELRISASRQLTDFEDGTDLAIRYISGEVPRRLFHSLLLSKDALVPLCSPSLLTNMHEPPTPDDLIRQTLIHFETPPDFPGPAGWSEWLEHAGVTGIDETRGLRFYQPEHAIDAAVQGAGVTLCCKLLALTELQAGRLVVPFGPEIEMAGMGYYLICPKQNKDDPKIENFFKWASEEMAMSLRDDEPTT
jgi:LysR family transcriptional regulator, glycine cleavage system transcriptional activator